MNKEILRLAIPNILSNLSVPLLSTVDTALMGRLSEVHVGAVGLSSMIFNFVYWNFGFLRMGTTGVTAQSYGRNNARELSVNLLRASSVALALAVVMLLLQWPLREGAVVLLQVEASVHPHVAEYFNIRIWAAPATLILYALMGWLFGMQNAIYPLIITVAVNVVNIAVSYLLVFEYDMEIAGVAWGTVIAQYFGLLIAAALLLWRYRDLILKVTRSVLHEVYRIDALSAFMRINRDIFIRTLCLTFAFGFFYSQSSALGESLLAVNVILMQYVNWMSYAIDGFAFATESIVGKYFGAGHRPQLLKAIRYNFLWALGSAALVSAAYALLGDRILYVFTDQADVIRASRPYLFWMILFPLVGFACYIWDGVYIGLTASVAMRNSMAVALVIFLVAYYTLIGPFHNHGLWLSLLVFLGARGALQWWWFDRHGLTLK